MASEVELKNGHTMRSHDIIDAEFIEVEPTANVALAAGQKEPSCDIDRVIERSSKVRMRDRFRGWWAALWFALSLVPFAAVAAAVHFGFI